MRIVFLVLVLSFGVSTLDVAEAKKEMAGSCHVDKQRFCGGKVKGLAMCLVDNLDKLTPACKAKTQKQMKKAKKKRARSDAAS